MYRIKAEVEKEYSMSIFDKIAPMLPGIFVITGFIGFFSGFIFLPAYKESCFEDDMRNLCIKNDEHYVGYSKVADGLYVTSCANKDGEYRKIFVERKK